MDVGREKNTWMDRRWGASGSRIPFALDVTFGALGAVDAGARGGRLRGGFDTLKCGGGEWKREGERLEFSVVTEGTGENDSYGDVSVPAGALYFAMSAYGGENWRDNVSERESTVCVRQMGWKTGWWRRESRIVGTARVKMLSEEVRRKDLF